MPPVKLGTAYLLWCLGLIGVCGVQRFYMGQVVVGVIYLLTIGVFGVGQLIDLFLIPNLVSKRNAQSNGARKTASPRSTRSAVSASKSSQGAIVALLVVAIGAIGFGVFRQLQLNSPVPASNQTPAAIASASPSPAPTAPPRQSSKPASPEPVPTEPTAIFNKLKGNTGYRPQIIDWGKGQALTVPRKTWQTLTATERQSVIDYSSRKGLKTIIEGEVKNSTTITLDRSVWGE